MATKKIPKTSAGKKRRKTYQRGKLRYAKKREDAQLSGEEAITPAGAVRDEVVDPRSQDEQRFPGLDRLAIRNDGNGWAVPESVRRKVIEKNAEVLFERRVIYKDGLEIELPPDRKTIIEASKVLLTADQRQYERDNPEEAGKAKGGGDHTVQHQFDWDALASSLRKKVSQEPPLSLPEKKEEVVDERHDSQVEGNDQYHEERNGDTDAS